MGIRHSRPVRCRLLVSYFLDFTYQREGIYGDFSSFSLQMLLTTIIQAGSLVQKSSQFIRNGGAVSYVYSQPACKDLANSNATKAIHNADSYEYFAENDPAIE